MTFAVAAESPLQDDVRALVQALNAYTYDLTPAEFRHHMTVEQMAAADTTVFIARDESGAAVGMGALRRHEGAGEVKRMFVAPSTRGSGLGGAILAEIEKLARAEGFPKLVLETGSNFDAAKRVYERAGFVTCDAVLDYPASPWNAFYQKTL
ncbi:MAG TPA: GNAT family N-acetyltransferase [Terricaulis sp.]|nr:GNAT family N-acetyltransferase [Terricaulis sp.]